MSALQTIIYPCLEETAIVGVCSVVALPFARQRNIMPLFGLLSFIAIDMFFLVIPLEHGLEVGRWNWTGKVASITLSLLVTRLYFSANEVGLRLPRSKSETVWTVVGVVVAAIAAFPAEWLEPSDRPDLETYAFEATLPGVDEEFAFRGVGLGCLIRAFSATNLDRRARFLALWVTALWFTAAHVLKLQHGHLVVTWHRVLDVLPYGIWLAVIRLRSGSLLGGIIAHNTSNTVQTALSAVGL